MLPRPINSSSLEIGTAREFMCGNIYAWRIHTRARVPLVLEVLKLIAHSTLNDLLYSAMQSVK